MTSEVADRPDTLTELATALQAVRVSVILSPGSGTNISSDWWSLEISELGVTVCKYGLEATQYAFVQAVAAETRTRVDAGNLSGPECALVTRLYLACLMGLLADLLQDAEVVELDPTRV